jgi:DsbC/DsbD-like thiol-disulfide interchange protein
MKILLVALLAMIGHLTAPAQAGTSDWVSVTGGAARVITSGPPENGAYRVGLEFSLDPGWHTYWRFPGEAGIPPQLDFSASENLAEADVKYPVPSRYDDGFTTSIVYEEGVVLPILVRPVDPDLPVTLRLSVFFGICKDICVPGDGAFEITLSPEDADDRVAGLLISRDLKLIPETVTPEASGIASIKSEDGDKGPVLRIEAHVESPDDPDLFAEGPQGSYIGVPTYRGREGRKAVWTLSTRGLARTGEGSTLTLLLVDGENARESEHPLEADLLD